jgi:long-chain acyl-CoA synthetase
VGRPLAGVELRIVDPASGRPVTPGAPGEFWVRAAQNTTDEWLATGDTGWQDDEGYLFLTGRLSDVINRGGEKLGPIEVEEVLRSHPAVRDAGVVGVPDPDLGERVGAVVVVADPVSVAELTAHCAARLASYKVPEHIGFADELPVTVLGKLDRRSLQGLLAPATVTEGTTGSLT